MLVVVLTICAVARISTLRLQLPARQTSSEHDLRLFPVNSSGLEDIEAVQTEYHAAFWEDALKGGQAIELSSWAEDRRLLMNSESFSAAFSTILACAQVKCTEFVPDEDGDVFPEDDNTAWDCVKSRCWSKTMEEQSLILSTIDLYMGCLRQPSMGVFVDVVLDVDVAFHDLANAHDSLDGAFGNATIDEVDFGDVESSPEEFEAEFNAADEGALGIEQALAQSQNQSDSIPGACRALRETKIPAVVQILWSITPLPVLVWLVTAAMQCSFNPGPCVFAFSSAISTITSTGLSLQEFARAMKYVLKVAHIKLDALWQTATSTGKTFKAIVMSTLKIQINLLDKIIPVMIHASDCWKRVFCRRSLGKIASALERIITKAHNFVGPTAVLSKVACFVSGKILEGSLKSKTFWVKLHQGMDAACSKSLLKGGLTLLKAVGFPVTQFALMKFVCMNDLKLGFKPWTFIKDADARSLTGTVAAIGAHNAAQEFVLGMDSVVWRD